MVLAQECEKRLRFVDRDTVELYKKIFGYSCISILDECPIPKKYLNALDLSVGANGSEELGGTTLVVGEKAIKEAIKETSEEADREAGEEAGREAGEETDGEISGEVRGETDGEFPAFESDDVISSLQFIIDLETISAIPSDLAHEFDHAEFVKVVERYAKGFEARGWSVLFDCRNSFNCLASEEPDACFNDSVCVLCDTATNATQEEPSAVACALHDSDATQDEGGVSTHILSDTKATQDESGFQRILVISDGSSALYNKVSSEFGKTCRVEQYWLLYFLREWIVERLCDRYASALNELGAHLVLTNCSWAFDHFQAEEQATSHDAQERSAYSKDSLAGTLDQAGHFLASIFEKDEQLAFDEFAGASVIPPIIEAVPGFAKHVDVKSKFLNVQNGIRYTSGNPADWDNSLYLFGGCTLFGYAVSDTETIASHLQAILNQQVSEKRWRVVNYGTWGGNFEHSHKRLGDIGFKKGDIVLVSHAMGNRPTSSLCESSFDMSEVFAQYPLSSEQYYDRIIHCGTQGYRTLANGLFQNLSHLFAADGTTTGNTTTGNTATSNTTAGNSLSSEPVRKLNLETTETMPEGLLEFIEGVHEGCPFSISDAINQGDKLGCLVMNCNPFTLGHRHVIEYASSHVDHLIIFVVEEDRSFFPFEDRIRLVREGVSDLPNVYVHRSGSLIISTTTFPGYFVKDNPDGVDVDPSLDVEIFAKWIAPELGISIRFVGEEPFDLVTRGYNEKMSEILPLYGISFVEIPRRTASFMDGSEKVISASSVRKELQLGNFDALTKFVPDTTLAYLKARFGEN